MDYVFKDGGGVHIVAGHRPLLPLKSVKSAGMTKLPNYRQ